MCIAICGFNQYPTRKELEQSCKNNPDGFGWAFVIKTETGRKLDLGLEQGRRTFLIMSLKSGGA